MKLELVNFILFRKLYVKVINVLKSVCILIFLEPRCRGLSEQVSDLRKYLIFCKFVFVNLCQESI